jgi:hypothetical protein
VVAVRLHPSLRQYHLILSSSASDVSITVLLVTVLPSMPRTNRVLRKSALDAIILALRASPGSMVTRIRRLPPPFELNVVPTLHWVPMLPMLVPRRFPNLLEFPLLVQCESLLLVGRLLLLLIWHLFPLVLALPFILDWRLLLLLRCHLLYLPRPLRLVRPTTSSWRYVKFAILSLLVLGTLLLVFKPSQPKSTASSTILRIRYVLVSRSTVCRFE